MFAELLKKIAGLIMPTNKHRAAVILPHSNIRDQKAIDAHLARMGHTIERRNQHIPVGSLADLFKNDTDRTEAAFERGMRRRIDSNTDGLRSGYRDN